MAAIRPRGLAQAMGAAALVAVALLALAAPPTMAKGGGTKLKRVGRFHKPVYATVAPGVPALLVVEQESRAFKRIDNFPRPGAR